MLRRYITNFDSEQIDKKETDCLIIGGGVAGLATAWYASQAGLKVTLAVRDTMLDSNTNKAQGGIAVALGEDDSLELHIEDTLIAGAGLCTEDIVALVVDEGRQAVLDLIELGAQFDSDENGICLGREGCHSRNRVIHAQGDATGREVVRALLHRVREEERITLREHLYAIDLLTTESVCEGALFMREDGTKEIIRAKTVVLATGGLGRLYLHTTNPEGATGSALAMAYRAGASLMDMEFVQFHPTALAIKGLPNFLISEAVRGEGGLLRNAEGKRFMPRFHKMEELAPRDVVARAIYHEMHRADTLSVSLDVSQIEDFATHFPTITASCKEYGLNLPEDMIPVAPAAHYMMGRIKDHLGKDFMVYSGCDEMAFSGLAFGASGIIGSFYNCIPELYLKIYDAFKKSDIKTAMKYQAIADEFIFETLKYKGISAIYELMKLRGIDAGNPIRPFVISTAENAEAMKEDLRRIRDEFKTNELDIFNI